jgi:hypothetical protein
MSAAGGLFFFFFCFLGCNDSEELKIPHVLHPVCLGDEDRDFEVMILIRVLDTDQQTLVLPISKNKIKLRVWWQNLRSNPTLHNKIS